MSKPNTDLTLMPYPSEVTLGAGRLSIKRDFSIYVPSITSRGTEDSPLHCACKRFVDRLYRQTGIPMLSWQADSAEQATLTIEVEHPEGDRYKQLNSDESYRLCVDEQGIRLSAVNHFGVLHGLETLLQLQKVDQQGFFLPCVSIQDSPRFAWRGVCCDSARRYLPIALLKRQLDAMAAAKLNVFHWHFWDDQAIRLQFESYPRLWQTTADGESYSKQEVTELVAYAAERGIRVIPEISLPGHASAVAHAYPELIALQPPHGYPHQRAWGVFEPLLNPVSDQLLPFFAAIFDELVALFPDRYIHIGGDEPNYQQWRDNPEIQAFIASHNMAGEQGLHAYLNTQVERLLSQRGKVMLGWDEVWHADLPRSVVIQSWQGHESLSRAAQQGFQGILSTGYYLDQAQPTAYHYRNDPIAQLTPLDDVMGTGEQAVVYEWVKPRPKDGVRHGNVIIISALDGTHRAFTDYDGKPRQAIEIVDYQPESHFIGRLDNFMSSVEFRFFFRQGKLHNSYQIIGNVRYPTFSFDTGSIDASSIDAGEGLPEPTGGRLSPMTDEVQNRILGGELTIWGENLDTLTFESRLWPRSFAIAERFWSAQSLRDEASMYQRLQAIDRWSVVSLGLRHHADSQMMLMRLAQGEPIAPLETLARYVEPAQYYARHWQKWQATPTPGELYNQYERLNRFVDALPVESLAVYEMEQFCHQLERSLLENSHLESTRLDKRAKGKAGKDKADTSKSANRALRHLHQHYQNAHGAAQQTIELLGRHCASAESVPLAQAVLEVADVGLYLLELFVSPVALEQEAKAMLKHTITPKLDENAQIFDETIVALVRPTERLLHILTN